jgi:hypothetical protein
MMPWSASSLKRSIAVRISRSTRCSSTSRCRCMDTRANGSDADASTMMTAVATTSSMYV